MRVQQVILVVDDSDDVRGAMVDVLQARGYVVLEAATGEDGLAVALDARPDLIVTDVVLPAMDGFEMVAHLQHEMGDAAPPVIVCSGFEITETEARRRGALMFLAKPVDAESLIFAVGLVLEGALATRPLEEQARRTADARRQTAHAIAHCAAIDLGEARLAARAEPALRWLRRYLDCAAAALLLADADDLHRVALCGDAPALDDEQRGTFRDQFRAVVDTCSSLLAPDLAVHPCFRGPPGEPAPRFVVAVPVRQDRSATVVGVLALTDDRPRRFEADDLRIVEEVGRRGSLLLGDADPRGDASAAAFPQVLRTDTFERLLGLELELAHRLTRPLHLIVLDVGSPAARSPVAAEILERVVWPRAALGRLGPARLGLFVRGTDTSALPDMNAVMDILERFPHSSITVTTGPNTAAGAAMALMSGAEEVLLHARQRSSHHPRLDRTL